MAQIRHQDPYDVVDEILTDAKNRGVMYFVTDTDVPIERHLEIGGRKFLNFGTCSYMSLGQDPRLKEAGFAFLDRYGLQFSVSRGYLSAGINEVLEHELSKIYDDKPVLVYSSTSACHISILPTLLTANDAIILDQSVHFSVQHAANIARAKGVPVEMIRHSNLDMLEDKLKEFGNKRRQIWYLIDGVYSMYGDVAPMLKLHELMHEYEQLHLYIDDAHGMSWYGTHGSGRVYGDFGMHPRTILVSTLAKGFGCTGGFAVFPNAEAQRKVRMFGGPFSYSHPLSPPVTGAAIACARIHLSGEIYDMQRALADNISRCSALLQEYDLPILSDTHTPINFVCLGTPKLGINVVKRMLDDGYYCNLSTFPVVPVKNTGLRFTIQRQLEPDDIEQFVAAVARNFRAGLKDECVSEADVRRQFGLEPPTHKINGASHAHSTRQTTHRLDHATSIREIDADEWNSLLGSAGIFDAAGCLALEQAFGGRTRPEERWDFDYFIVRDGSGRPLLATFFTTSVYKDDIFAQPSISAQIEEKRKQDPMYLTSRTMGMGCLLSEGQHLYVDRSREDWPEAIRFLLGHVLVRQRERNATALLLRDFDAADDDIRRVLTDEGFVKIDMPLSNAIENMRWETRDEFLQALPSTRRRRHMRQEFIPYEHMYEVETKSELSPEEQEWAYRLYLNVAKRNLSINIFQYPSDVLKSLVAQENWEFVVLRLKADYDDRAERLPVAVSWNYRGKLGYHWVIVGIDYEYNRKFGVYRQAMYQTVRRARLLGYEHVSLGLSSDEEKKKVGADQTEKVAYHQTRDTFAMDVMAAMAAVTQ
ncbi:bifunctional aminotransferase class I/II-fold pyridoxal phosphate-dependent enzyme/GNAT family N-acetyltransferase [Mycobacterium marinum]|uniref:bifunctional aminotransferase class I/II-fold pyridoxal phosphate-dependent enzyme/GNAT family N-acetyltransferase n=1 Tax=Mycobacterium marinum TaxID=1781 RepID=UPI00235953A7|nr:bifunctional aminotransferase class I/II-fold pyridoxal phosphate-dependent enzyme/GNAT family N-acetyltransferase [Mycobacterium marinum]MDC8973400.1 bifunctional aminotransferase class I/II-fold pyridoxal phosphate-dependent enzyme/GNAT family N-acetyltransferase [Mycobacterium marinum]